MKKLSLKGLMLILMASSMTLRRNSGCLGTFKISMIVFKVGLKTGIIAAFVAILCSAVNNILCSAVNNAFSLLTAEQLQIY